MDIDWIWHQYRTTKDRIGKREVNHIMLIEEKSNGADLTFSQRDTMFLLHQALRRIDGFKNLKLKTVRGDKVRVRFWGCFKLQYEGLCLNDAAWIKWNFHDITIEQLEAVLRFELSPITLMPLSDRRHHPPKRYRDEQETLSLF